MSLWPYLAVVAAMAWLGCSHTPKAPDNEVIRYSKSGNDIVIQSPRTALMRVPVSEFKNRIIAALSVPGGYYFVKNGKNESNKPDDAGEFDRQRAEIRRAFQQIQVKAQDKTAIEAKLSDKYDLPEAIREINQMIAEHVAQIMTQPKLEKSTSAKTPDFEFNILRSYLKSPVISARFAKIEARTFEVGQTEVTQSQWFEVMGYNPSRFKRKENCPNEYLDIHGTELCPNHPVETVSWLDAQEFIKRLNSASTSYVYRLPTETEWESAARSGTSDPLDDYAWYANDSGGHTHAVRTKKPNAYGLYDMYGNVWEWVQDYYAKDPTDRVVRGGSWRSLAVNLRSAGRYHILPAHRLGVAGFRLVRTAK
jgi:hypothetical protein